MLTLSRSERGYRLTGRVGGLDVRSVLPLTIENARAYVRLLNPCGDEPLIVDLPADDPLAHLGTARSRSTR